MNQELEAVCEKVARKEAVWRIGVLHKSRNGGGDDIIPYCLYRTRGHQGWMLFKAVPANVGRDGMNGVDLYELIASVYSIGAMDTAEAEGEGYSYRLNKTVGFAIALMLDGEAELLDEMERGGH